MKVVSKIVQGEQKKTSQPKQTLDLGLNSFMKKGMKNWYLRSKRVIYFAIILFGFFAMRLVQAEMSNIDNLLVHVISPIRGEKILSTTYPLPGESINSIYITACRGEYEPASFVLHAISEDIDGLEINPTPLKGDSRDIPAEDVDIKVVKEWYQGGTAWKGIKADSKRVLVPELLLKDDDLVMVDYVNKENYLKLDYPKSTRYVRISDPAFQEKRVDHTIDEYPVKDNASLRPVNIKNGQNKQFWVTVKVPTNAMSGTYTGRIELKKDTVKIGTINITLRVLPFDLDMPKLEYSIYYRGKLHLGQPTISSEWKNITQLKAELQNMLEHGIVNPTVYQPLNEKELFDKTLLIRKEVGIKNDSLYYLGINTGMPRTEKELFKLKKQITELIELAKKHNVTDVFIYGIDEAKGDVLLAQRQAWTTVHDAGGKVFVAGRIGYFDKIGDLLDLLVAAYEPSRDEANKYHSVGNRVFCYANPQAGVENPLVFRRNYGIKLWQAGYDGAMVYAYQHSTGSIWNDFDGKYREHCFTYPTINGVVDTLAWEGLREAVDDVRYITTLERYIATESSTYIANQKHANCAKEFLDKLRNQPLEDLDALRLKVINFILKFIEPNVSH